MATASFRNVAVVSIGEMGLGIAQLLLAHGYRVFTYAADRSERTRSRAKDAGIELSPTLEQLVADTSCLLSIVPPRDAFKTAERILAAVSLASVSREAPLYYLDLNAIAPESAARTNKLFEPNSNIILVDGGIIGGVPYAKGHTADGKPNWHCPSLIVSGPDRLPDQGLANILNIQHLDLPIGSATGLKMCFAVMTKGFISLAIQSFTTAHELGVLSELQAYLERYNPSTLKLAQNGLVTMPPKAYRWVHEMLEIADTMAENGGFERTLFQGVAEVYRAVAEDSELGKELPGERVRGKTAEDVVQLMSEGVKSKKGNAA